MAKLTLDLHDIFNRGTHIEAALHNILREALDKKIPLIEITPANQLRNGARPLRAGLVA